MYTSINKSLNETASYTETIGHLKREYEYKNGAILKLKNNIKPSGFCVESLLVSKING